MFSLLVKLFEMYRVDHWTMEMQLTLKLSGYEVSSHFYGAKFLGVLMNNWDWVFLLQVNFYKVLYNLFENNWCETHVQHQNVEKLCLCSCPKIIISSATRASSNHNFECHSSMSIILTWTLKIAKIKTCKVCYYRVGISIFVSDAAIWMYRSS